MAQSRRLRVSNQRYDSVVAQIQRYIKDRGASNVNFSQNTHGLTVIPSADCRMVNNNKDVVVDITFRQPIIQDKVLRLRQNAPFSSISPGSEQDFLGNLQVYEGDKWMPLHAWIYRHYEDPAMFRHDVKSLIHLESIKDDIVRRQLTDFDFWSRTHGLRICVDTSSRSSPWNYVLACYGTESLKFEALCKHQSVLILPGTSRLPLANCDQWRQFSDLVMTELASRPLDPTLTQAQWWDSNGSTFRILDLPPELRATIYRQITGPYLWPHTRDVPWTYLWYKRKLLPGRITMFHPTPVNNLDARGSFQFLLDPLGNRPPPPTCLVGVSKQIKDEFWVEAQRYTTKHFQGPRALGFYIFDTFRTCALYRISLGFPNWRFYEFLGFQSYPRHPFVDTSKPQIKIFAKLSALKYLTFNFQIAVTSGPSLDPWCWVCSNHVDVSCQKPVVDWFLTLALAHIRHIPHISISGHVKNSTRAKWEAIFEDERQGIQHDMSAQIQDILSTHWTSFPILCVCEHPCDWWNQHGPYSEAERDPNFDPMPHPSHIDYEPRKHDRFNYEG